MKLGLMEYRPSKKSLVRSGIVLLGTVVVVVGLEIRERCFKEEVTQIERNDYGEGIRKEELNLEIEGERNQTVVLEISPRAFSDEEIEALFSEAMDVLEKTMLDQNESLEYVTENLNLSYELEGYPFVISWQLSRYDVVDMAGRIQRDKLKKIDPKREGVPVTVTAILRYEEKEAVYKQDLVIFSPEEEKQSISEDVLDVVSQMNSQLREESYITLPDTVSGRKIVWKKEQKSNAVILLILGMVMSILLVFQEQQQKKEEKKKKQEQMLLDYSEIISQFIILMGAGMTAKNVWKKIVEDYRKQKIYSGRIRWAYEEMEITWMEMQNGVPELDCYEHFAKRCYLLPYIKL